jgi:hypothetical protein
LVEAIEEFVFGVTLRQLRSMKSRLRQALVDSFTCGWRTVRRAAQEGERPTAIRSACRSASLTAAGSGSTTSGSEMSYHRQIVVRETLRHTCKEPRGRWSQATR